MKAVEAIAQFHKMLKNLDGWIAKAEAHATTKKFEADTLVHARLAPDQYSFARQVQSACDAAKFAAQYLSTKTAPVFPDTEKTLTELRTRLHGCGAYLETVGEADLAGADEKKVAPPWMHGKWLRGDQYLMQLAIPNFYFHITTAYSILRHNGVELGKQDFVGQLPIKD